MRFVNMTPHVLNVVSATGAEPLVLPPSGNVVRVAVATVQVGEVEDVPLFRATYGEVEGLPEQEDGVLYVVSGMALEAIKALGRSDFAAPGELLRDAAGQPIGCKGLKVN